MYNIIELESMEESQLRKVASDMGIEKSQKTPVQALIYEILDHQAIDNAKEQAAKASENKKSPGRGRRKKNEEAAQPQATIDTAANAAETTAEAPQPKKRGRKPKAKAEDAVLPLMAEDTAAEPVQSATQQAAPATADGAEVPVKRKRGRPKKVKPEEAEAVAVAEPVPVTTPLTEEQNAAETQGEAHKPEQPAAENRNGSNGSFNSFFGNSKGRTFTPRAKRQEGEAEEPVAVENTPAPSPEVPAKPRFENNQQGQQHQQFGQHNQQPQQKQRLTKRQRQQMRQQQQQQQQMQSGAPVTLLMPRATFNFEGMLTTSGVLEVMPEGYGFLRSSDYNYLTSPDDVYVNQQYIKELGLKTGDVVEGSIEPPKEGDKFYPLATVFSVNGLDPQVIRDRIAFEHLTPLFPDEKFNLSDDNVNNISCRVVDMFAPIGKGQRALIVAPPKTGKTILLKDIANAISRNHPDTYIIMLLIDERPEEVTDMARSVNAEVIASTFDEPADRHVKIAGIVLEKAKRLVECGHDVVIMLDSITRLARAYNTVSPASGKILSGGVDANALQRPKRFFGAARNIENGGSLTIIATALTETSSKMDEVIFEEFKGTGNMELQLDRKLSNKRIYPAVDIIASSTRRDDLLCSKETVNRMWILRNYLADMNSQEAMEFIKGRMEMTRNNLELLVTMDKA